MVHKKSIFKALFPWWSLKKVKNFETMRRKTDTKNYENLKTSLPTSYDENTMKVN